MKNPRSWHWGEQQAVYDFPEKAGWVNDLIETICPENGLVYVLTEIDS
jgi:hypothetical protein